MTNKQTTQTNSTAFEQAYSNWYDEIAKNPDETFISWLKNNMPEHASNVSKILAQAKGKKANEPISKIADSEVILYFAKLGMVSPSGNIATKLILNKFKFGNDPMTLKTAIAQLAQHYKNQKAAKKSKGN